MEKAVVFGEAAQRAWYITEPISSMSKQRVYEAIGCITLAIKCGVKYEHVLDRRDELIMAVGGTPPKRKKRKDPTEHKKKAVKVKGNREEGKLRYDEMKEQQEEEPF